jgi:hypothetical protein
MEVQLLMHRAEILKWEQMVRENAGATSRMTVAGRRERNGSPVVPSPVGAGHRPFVTAREHQVVCSRIWRSLAGLGRATVGDASPLRP